ncbi:MAG: ferredoxin/flavodoxin---NADP+ reductase [Chloroflexota bacterium]|nr:ferredoxin/flavodoxin---NADP+ reductase [Chloroflexota bacterium]
MTDIARDIDAAAAQLGATATPAVGAATGAASAAGSPLAVGAALAGTEAPGLIATEDERYNATLVRRVDQHESLGYFWVRFDEEPTPFEPGQYMTIGVFVDGKIVQRPYSVASAPGEAGDTGYEFYLRLVQGGTFTPLLWDLPVGHRMRMIGPKGKFLLEPDDTRTHLFISSGTGNAPFISMMRDMLAAGAPRPAVFLNGVSHARDLGYADIVEGWAASGEYPVTFIPTVSRPNDPMNADWMGRTGRVESIVAPIVTELKLDPADTVAYLCGNPDMIQSAEASLLEIGFPEEAVKKELYWPKGKEPRGVAGAADVAAAIDAAEANADQ